MSISLAGTTSLFIASSYLYTRYITHTTKTRSRKRSSHTLTLEEAARLRKHYFGDNVSVSYSNSQPLMIMEGKGTRLLSSEGKWYLDTRNNVAHCGHSHPYITSSISNQLLKLNTNTRYLHPNQVHLAEELVSKLPDPLQVVFFTNSGSEANDLAMRMALCRNSSGNVVVVDGGYHGHTLGTVKLSPYKVDKSSEQAIHDDKVQKVPCPNTFRKRTNPGEEQDDALHYAKFVQETIQHKFQNNVTAMILEGGMSVAGVILPPPHYLQTCADAVRKAGGVFISDEVQTGFGRLGTCFWSFQFYEEFVPDIVTVGKPFGNGMPLAAVVTTREIADAFAGVGVEYFNTFGGNTVCTAAGLAMMEVLENERLQENAKKVGTYLIHKLKELQQQYTVIGDIRGSGLFLGIEFIRDPNTLEPATAEASFLCSNLKNKYGILTSFDGPNDNVMVIKPPMCFGMEHADEFLMGLRNALRDLDGLRSDELSGLVVTPT